MPPDAASWAEYETPVVAGGSDVVSITSGAAVTVIDKLAVAVAAGSAESVTATGAKKLKAALADAQAGMGG